MSVTKQGGCSAFYTKYFFSPSNLSRTFLLYKLLVLPHLEYACQIWSLHNTADIENQEGVQQFTLRINHG